MRSGFTLTTHDRLAGAADATAGMVLYAYLRAAADSGIEQVACVPGPITLEAH